MKEEKTYLASADIAERAGCIDSSYRTKEGKFIISESALRDFRFRMTAEEYVTGLDIEMLTPEEAIRLARENNYAIGRDNATEQQPESQEIGEGNVPQDEPQEVSDQDEHVADNTPEEESNINEEEE